MFSVNGAQVDLDDEGRVVRVVDAAHTLSSYATGLAAQGLTVPVSVITD